jgi:hypothetical protein
MYNLIQDIRLKQIRFPERIHEMINTGNNNF